MRPSGSHAGTPPSLTPPAFPPSGQNQLMKKVLVGLALLTAIQTPEALGLDGSDAVLIHLGMSRCAREKGWLTKQEEKKFASQLLAIGESMGQLTIDDFEEVMKLPDLSRQINKAIADAGGCGPIRDSILPAVQKFLEDKDKCKL